MDISEFISGTYKEGYEYKYFVPTIVNKPFTWSDGKINQLLEKASLKLGELNSFSRFIPDTDMFTIMHIHKEAVESSRIEGTQTSIEESLSEEKNVDPEKRDDWKEVNNYVNAMNFAIHELKKIPLSNRLLKSVHKILLSSARGETKLPGEFRSSQNWIGGSNLSNAVFIPPSHVELADLMGDLELFLNNSEIMTPHIVKIAIAHYQFETIHPFLDGNGRIGRLLIALYLVTTGILDQPLLYISNYFERNRSEYYEKLTSVRGKNELKEWIIFFLTGVIETADNSVDALKNIIDLKKDIEENKISKLNKKRAEHASLLFSNLFKKPSISSKDVQSMIGLSQRASDGLIKTFVELDILNEVTGLQRNRTYVFSDYINLFKR